MRLRWPWGRDTGTASNPVRAEERSFVIPAADPGLFEITTTGGRITHFEVFGERCSGTNFLAALIAGNLSLSHGEDYGWKHAFPTMLATRTDALAVVVFRHVEPWLHSVFRTKWHFSPQMKALDFSGFLRAPWETEIDETVANGWPQFRDRIGRPFQWDRDPVTGEAPANVVALRNAKLAAFLSYPKRFDHCVLVAYERVSHDPEAFIRTLSETLNLPLAGGFTGIDSYKGKGERPFRLQEPQALAPADHAFVLREIDRTQEARLGYRLDPVAD